MTETANQLLLWSSTTGTKRSLLLIKDDEKDQSDIDYKWLEVCSYDKEENEWRTEERIDFVDEIEDFGIPDSFID